MAEPKTKPTSESVTAFLKKISDPQKQHDSFVVARMMAKITGKKAVMWGPSIVGFGTWQYTYASGRTGDWPLAAFSPRKQGLVVYIMSGFKTYDGLMAKIGKHKCGKACLYLDRLADVHLPTLEKLIRDSARHLSRKG